MSAQLPTYFLMMVFAGWLNRQQQAAIEYLKAENEILKSQFKGGRPRLKDGDRRRLAEKGRALGRKLLPEVACIVTPETILTWHRRLVARKWTVNRQQQAVIEFLFEENQVLRSQLKGRRLRLTDGDRRRLAVKGKVLGRKFIGRGAAQDVYQFWRLERSLP